MTNFSGIHKYTNLDEGLEEAAPELLEKSETHYLYMQLKLARQALKNHVESLEEAYWEEH